MVLPQSREFDEFLGQYTISILSMNWIRLCLDKVEDKVSEAINIMDEMAPRMKSATGLDAESLKSIMIHITFISSSLL